jgi:hypothetical protein
MGIAALWQQRISVTFFDRLRMNYSGSIMSPPTSNEGVKSWASHGGRPIRKWAREFEETKELPLSQRGAHRKVFSLLSQSHFLKWPMQCELPPTAKRRQINWSYSHAFYLIPTSILNFPISNLSPILLENGITKYGDQPTVERLANIAIKHDVWADQNTAFSTWLGKRFEILHDKDLSLEKIKN